MLIFIIHGRPAPDALSRIFGSLALLFVILSVREVFVFRDNARWLTEEVERESRARFEALVRHSSDVIMVVDAQRTIRFASPAVAVALGTSAEGIMGRQLLDLAHPDDAATGSEFLDKLLGAPKALQTVQWRLRHSDGTYRYFETVGSSAGEGAATEGLVINSRDVTDRVALEEKLRQAQKLEALGQLVGGIAHSFNNILTSTMMRLGFLRENRQLPAEVSSQILALDAEAKRSADLTKKLVSFGQQQFLRKEPIDLRESMARLQPEIARLLGKGMELRVTGGPSPAWVEADPALIDQVIMSLCTNARDAMAEGGCLTVDVTRIDDSPAASAPGSGARPGSLVRLSFKDTGCGMDSSVRQRLFEPFFTTKGVGRGLGLGLAAVHGIVKQHAGWIEVESSPGLGSTFRIYVPGCSEAPAR
jgi:PAS domain S-box-containing protein